MKCLTFITLSRATFRVFHEQLKEFFRGKVCVKGLCLEDHADSWEIDTGLCVASSQDAVELVVSRLLNGNARPQVIVSRRTIDPSKLAPLFGIPPGTKVLVVNNAEDLAVDAAQVLRNYGLAHLDLEPWWPGAPCRTNATGAAVTFGFPDLVPSGIPQVYDLGTRPLDISTLVEIGLKLGLCLDGIHHSTAAQYKGVVGVIQRQMHLVNELESIGIDLEAILDSIFDAVITFDHAGNIKRVNTAARRMLGTSDPVGSNLRQWFSDSLLEFNNIPRPTESSLCKIGDRNYLVTVIPLEQGECQHVLIAREEDTIERARGSLTRAKRRSYQGGARYTFKDIIGNGPAISKAVGMAKKLARTSTTVFITGETGTGKELFAQAVHNASSRRSRPFVAQNLSALPEQLVQSELFGYERGAFTGALREGKRGLFELADGGTVFLDEIGDMSSAVQISLLRVLQEREVTRVGGSILIPVDVRIIAATNQDLLKAMNEGRFRKDLYYRLCAFPLRIPAMRERKHDIASLARHFALKYCHLKVEFPPSLIEGFSNHVWPGNVRELEGLIKYAASVADTPTQFTDAIEEYLEKPLLSKDNDSNTLYDIACRLRQHGEVKDFCPPLEALAAVFPRGLGRVALTERLNRNHGQRATVAQTKTRLKILNSYGLAKSFLGKKGTVLTPLGRRFLDHLSE